MFFTNGHKVEIPAATKVQHPLEEGRTSLDYTKISCVNGEGHELARFQLPSVIGWVIGDYGHSPG